MKSAFGILVPLTLVAVVAGACGDDEDTTGTGGSGASGTTTTTSGMGGDASTTTTTCGMGGMTTTSTTTGGMGGGGGCTPEAGCFNYCDFTPDSNVTFNDVYPILQANCQQANCHGGVNNGRFAGDATAVYNSITGWNPNQSTQPNIDPGVPSNSYLMIKIDGDMGCDISGCNSGCNDRMPKNGPPYMPEADANVIRSWIANGAPAP